jgi:hypothetical protein
MFSGMVGGGGGGFCRRWAWQASLLSDKIATNVVVSVVAERLVVGEPMVGGNCCSEGGNRGRDSSCWGRSGGGTSRQILS